MGLLLLSVGLGTLGSDASALECIESSFRGVDLRLGLVSCRLQLSLLSRRTAALKQVA